MPAGQAFATWIKRRGCAKSTAYKYLADLGLRLERVAGPDGKPQPWVSQEQSELLTYYADALSRGLRTAEALEAMSRAGLVVAPSAAITAPPAAEPQPVEQDRERLELLALRLRALRDAVELGAPLGSADAAALLDWTPAGVTVGESVERAGIEAQHLGRDLWRLGKAGSSSTRGRW